jgi:peptide/nickel transport system permease protein
MFNLLLLLSPLYALAFAALRRRLGVRRLLLGLAALHAILCLAVVPERLPGRANPLFHRAPVENASAEIAAREAAGETVRYLFPLHRYHYRSTDPAASVRPPSADHWLGTDKEGRDVFTRMLYGTRISLTIGVVAVAIYVAIGVVLGALAGYFGGWIDIGISRMIEVMICIPSFFLILTLAAFVEERSIFHVMAIIGVTSWTGVARLVRAEFLQQRSLEYAQAAEALGIPRARIIFRHLLPNSVSPVLVSATFGVASAILIESSLSFLGLGDLSVPSWGEILNSGRLEQKLWLILAPGVAIFFVVSVVNLVGEGLRDALDPKLRT